MAPGTIAFMNQCLNGFTNPHPKLSTTVPTPSEGASIRGTGQFQTWSHQPGVGLAGALRRKWAPQPSRICRDAAGPNGRMADSYRDWSARLGQLCPAVVGPVGRPMRKVELVHARGIGPVVVVVASAVGVIDDLSRADSLG